MAVTSRQLIIDAWYLSGIVARELQTVDGTQIDDGLELLNDFLSIKNSDTGMIPYYRVVNGNFVTGQELYFIPGLTRIESLTFYLTNPDDTNSVRYSMREVTREEYFATGRVEHITTLPYQWHLERVFGGANLRVYYAPNQDYPYQLVGKYGLEETVLNQDLSLVYDRDFRTYLKYGLAQYMCEFYNVVFPPMSAKKLAELENNLRDKSPMDLTMRKLEYFPAQSSLTYAQSNIGRAYTTP